MTFQIFSAPQYKMVNDGHFLWIYSAPQNKVANYGEFALTFSYKDGTRKKSLHLPS